MKIIKSKIKKTHQSHNILTSAGVHHTFAAKGANIIVLFVRDPKALGDFKHYRNEKNRLDRFDNNVSRREHECANNSVFILSEKDEKKTRKSHAKNHTTRISRTIRRLTLIVN
ncbi:hypothetical protein QTP88_025834 [Uroleucon formosanum]